MNTIQGIYLIERVSAEARERRYYVGLAVDIFDRWRQHCCQYSSTQFIDKTIRTDGADKFVFSILEIVESRKDLKARESFWIQKYRDLYSDELLYNRSETANTDPWRDINKEIQRLFKADIGQSIYAVAEKFHIPFKEVLVQRKKLLPKFNLKYDRASKQIVDVLTGRTPDDWRGGLFTRDLAEKIDQELISNDISTAAKNCDVSVADLQYYLSHKEGYTFAVDLF